MTAPRTPPAGDKALLADSGRWASYGPRQLRAGIAVSVEPVFAEFWGVYVWDDDPLGGQWNWVGDARDRDSAAYFATRV